MRRHRTEAIAATAVRGMPSRTDQKTQKERDDRAKKTDAVLSMDSRFSCLEIVVGE